MIKEFIEKFNENKEQLRSFFKSHHPQEYEEIVKVVIEAVKSAYEYNYPDSERIHKIDDGEYQGTLVFVIAGEGYQPSDYWYVKVSYGSCSGCDTLQSITNYSDDPPDDEQVNGYMTLALHIVQGLKKMGEEAV